MPSSKRIRNTTLFTLLACISSLFMEVQANVPQESSALETHVEQQTVTGVLRNYSTNKPDVYAESWVVLSSQGMRITDEITQSEIIKNFAEERVWLQDRKSKLRHEVDVVEFNELFPELTHYLVGRETKSNVLGSQPCSDWASKLNGERVWRGMVVQDWSCTEESGVLINTQYFSEPLGMVVRVQHPDSMVEELRNIATRENQAKDYQPDAGFKSVSYLEFANIKKTLDSFKD